VQRPPRQTGGSLWIAVIGAVLLAAQQHAAAPGAVPGHAFAAGCSDGLLIAAVLTFAAAVVAGTTLGRPSHRLAPVHSPATAS
jgi:hypothetical protein